MAWHTSISGTSSSAASGQDLRPTARGIEIFTDETCSFEPLPAPLIPRSEVIGELCGAVLEGRAPLHSGGWARTKTEVCLAILDSARSRAPRPLSFQMGVPE